MRAVRKRLESFRRRRESSGGIVAEYGSQVFENFELEDPKIGIVRAKL